MARERDVAAFGERAQCYDQGWFGQLYHQVADRAVDLALRAGARADPGTPGTDGPRARPALPPTPRRRRRPAGTLRKVEGHHLPLEVEEYKYVYSKVPRLTVEIIVRDESGALYLTRRFVEPCKGQWHLPGGTVRFGEALLAAVRRVAMRELSIDVRTAINRGYIEYPSHYLSGLDSPVGLVFEVTAYDGAIAVNDEASDGGWFTKLPQDMHADQDAFLLAKGYLTA